MSRTLCPFCKELGFAVNLELTESMLLICTSCSRVFAVKIMNIEADVVLDNVFLNQGMLIMNVDNLFK